MLIQTGRQNQNQEKIDRANHNEQTRAINTGVLGHSGQHLPVTLFICLLIIKTFRKKLSSFLKTVICCHSRTTWISVLSQIWEGMKEHRTSPFRPAGFTALISPINTPFSPNKNTNFLTFNPIGRPDNTEWSSGYGRIRWNKPRFVSGSRYWVDGGAFTFRNISGVLDLKKSWGSSNAVY